MPPHLAQWQGGVAEDWLTRWCRQYGVDMGAERVLRQLHPEAQRRVIDEGPVGGLNPSLDLMARIHRFEAWEHGFHATDFLRRNFVDASSEEAFRQLSVEQQRSIMGRGPLMSSDRMGELQARIREVARQGADAMADFARENSIDANAEAALRSLPNEMQQRVLLEGPVRSTKNPSAVLMSRIKRVRREGGPNVPALPDSIGRRSRSSSRRPEGGGPRSRSRSAAQRERSGSRAGSPIGGTGPEQRRSKSRSGARRSASHSRSPTKSAPQPAQAPSEDQAAPPEQPTSNGGDVAVTPELVKPVADLSEDPLAGFARSGGMSY